MNAREDRREEEEGPSSLVFCVNFLGCFSRNIFRGEKTTTRTITKTTTSADKEQLKEDAIHILIESAHRIVQDLCYSNEFLAENVVITFLGRGGEVKGRREHGRTFFSIKPNRKSTKDYVTEVTARMICKRFYECIRDYVEDSEFDEAIRFGISTTASLAKICCSVNDKITVAWTSTAVNNSLRSLHPCDTIPEFANNALLREKIDKSDVTNVFDLMQREIGFFTGTLGLSKKLTTKVMSSLKEFDAKPIDKAKKITPRTQSSLSEFCTQVRLDHKSKNATSRGSVFAAVTRDLSRNVFLHGVFFCKWPKNLECFVQEKKAYFEFPQFRLFDKGFADRVLLRKTLVGDAKRILNEKSVLPSSLIFPEIMNQVGEKLTNIIRNVIEEEADGADGYAIDIREIRLRAYNFTLEVEDFRILGKNDEAEEVEEEVEIARCSDDDDGDDNCLKKDIKNDDGEDENNPRENAIKKLSELEDAFMGIYGENLEENYEGEAHQRGRFHHEFRPKSKKAPEIQRIKTLQTEQHTHTLLETTEAVKKNKTTIQPLIISTMVKKPKTGPYRQSESDGDAEKRLLGNIENGEAVDFSAIMDHLDCGESHPSVVEKVLISRAAAVEHTCTLTANIY